MTLPTASDAYAVSYDYAGYASGMAFPVGITSLTFTATDANNQSSTCSFEVFWLFCPFSLFFLFSSIGQNKKRTNTTSKIEQTNKQVHVVDRTPPEFTQPSRVQCDDDAEVGTVKEGQQVE